MTMHQPKDHIDTALQIAECRLKLEMAANDPETAKIIQAEIERLELKLREIGDG